jgi:hypothetical protein
MSHSQSPQPSSTSHLNWIIPAGAFASLVLIWVLTELGHWANTWLSSPIAFRSLTYFGAVLPWLLVAAAGFYGLSLFLHPSTKRFVSRMPSDALQMAAFQVEKARNTAVPHSLSIAMHNRQEIEGAPVIDVPFQEVPMDLAMIKARDGILYGTDMETRQLIEAAPHESAMSMGLGGMTNSGKSNTMALLAHQYTAKGDTFVLCDPHESNKDGTYQRFKSSGLDVPMVSTNKEIEREVGKAWSELQSRKRTGRPPSNYMIFLDEFCYILRSPIGKLIGPKLADIIQEGRKFGVGCLLAAQLWKINKDVPYLSDLRDSLPGHIVHRCRGDALRMQVGIAAGDLPTDPMDLKAGEAYFLGWDGRPISRIKVPYITGQKLLQAGFAEVSEVGLEATSEPTSPSRPIGFDTTPRSGSRSGSEVGPPALSEVGQKALELCRNGQAESVAKAVEKVLGTKGGERYGKLCKELNDYVMYLTRI